MKTTTLTTGMALTGALLVSASVARANAYMELISGSTTLQIEPGGALLHSGSYTADFYTQTGDGALFVGAIGTWSVDIASGGESGGFNVTLTDNINGSATQNKGLEVIFSSGVYDLGLSPLHPGHYNFGTSESGGNSLQTKVLGYYNNTLYTGSGSFGTSLEPAVTVPTAPGAAKDPAGPWILPKVTAASYQNVDIPIYGNRYITEIMEFGLTTGSITPQKVTMNATASFTPFVPPVVVPDGGMTGTMVGLVLLGLVGLRAKFGSQRA